MLVLHREEVGVFLVLGHAVILLLMWLCCCVASNHPTCNILLRAGVNRLTYQAGSTRHSTSKTLFTNPPSFDLLRTLPFSKPNKQINKQPPIINLKPPFFRPPSHPPPTTPN